MCWGRMNLWIASYNMVRNNLNWGRKKFLEGVSLVLEKCWILL